MNLRNISVSMQDDGFSIVDPESIIKAGAPLRLQYELPDGWTTKDIEFEVTDRPTLFHPFRKRSMFVYTGRQPSRVIVQEVPDPSTGAWGAKFARAEFVRQTFYQSRNFQVWPDYDQPVWQGDDFLPASLGVVFEDAPVQPPPVPEPPVIPAVPEPPAASGPEAAFDPNLVEPDMDSLAAQDADEPNAY